MKKYILDKEVELSDENDLLKTKVYANTLVKAIDQAPKDDAFTIGLFGEWGSGKSSIIKTAQKEIENRQGQKNKFIIYDAWKYANDSFRRMFLRKILEELKFDQTDLLKSFYLNENEDVQIHNKLSNTRLIVIILIFVIGIGVLNFLPMTEVSGWLLSLPAFISLLGLLTAVFFRAFDQYKVNIQKPHFFAPEQFEECFGEMMQLSLKKNNLITNIKYAGEWISNGGKNYEKDIDHLVIVIDNIDRCHKEQAYELLTNLKNFLSNSFSIVFLIPVDDNALKKHLFKSSKNENPQETNEKEEFLRKFFNATIRIKPHRDTELISFVERLNRKHQLELHPDTINLLGSNFATNPRRIIQLINNLSAELNNYDIEFAKVNETAIAVFLIIREEWEDYYNFISNDASQFHNARDKTLEFSNNDSRLSIFLMTIKPIMRHIHDEVIRKIVTNSEANFAELPDELKANIRACHSKKVIASIKEDASLKRQIIDFVLDELKTGIKGPYRTKYENSFKFICDLSLENLIDHHENKRIVPVISQMTEELVRIKDNYEKTVNYAVILKRQQETVLENEILNRIQYIDNEEGVIDKDARELFYNFINIADLDQLNRENNEILANGLLKLYVSPEFWIHEQKELDLQRLSAIANSKFINHIIEQVQFSPNNDPIKDIILLSEFVRIDSNKLEKIFNSANSEYPDFINVDSEEIVNLLRLTNRIFQHLDNHTYSKDRDAFEEWFNKVFDDRKVLKDQYKDHQSAQTWSNNPSSYPQQFDTLNLIDEADEECLSDILKLCYETYRLTSNNVSTAHIFGKLFETESRRDLVRKELLKLKAIGFHLKALHGLILSDTEYTSDTLELLKFIIIRQTTNKAYSLNDSDFFTKLEELYELSFNNSDIMPFLESIKEDERVSKKLIELISKDTQENILQLHTDLWTLASDRLDIFAYKDNLGFIKAVAQKGSKLKVRDVVRVIIHKLNSEQNIDEALEITDQLNRVNKPDSNNLISSFNSFNNDDDELKKKIKDVVKYVKGITD